MIKSLTSLLVLVLLTQASAGQLTNLNVVQSENLGSATNLMKHSTSGHWVFTTLRSRPINGNNELYDASIHIYSNNFQQKLHGFLIDSLPMITPRLFEIEGRIWVCTWQMTSSAGFIRKGSNAVKIRRLSHDLSMIDTTISYQFNDSLSFVDCEVAGNEVYLHGEFKDQQQINLGRVKSIYQLIKLNNQMNIIQNSTIDSRNGLPTMGITTSIYPLNDSNFAISGIAQKIWVIGQDSIYQINGDIAVYKRQNLELILNDVIHPQPLAAWPLADIGRHKAPRINSGFINDKRTGNYFYSGNHTDTLYPPAGVFAPTFGQQKVYMAKLNSNFDVTARHFFGHPGVNDVPQLERALTLGPNGRLYSLFTKNFLAWFGIPDSVQTLVVYSVDTNFNNPEYHYWNDGNDVLATALIADSAGVYILANSVGRAGEKFHVLRIDGTGWASSSSQPSLPQWQVYPNPTQGQLYLQGTTLPSKLILRDVQGKVVTQQQTPEDGFLTLPGVPSGMYFLHGSNEKGEHWPVKKIVVR